MKPFFIVAITQHLKDMRLKLFTSNQQCLKAIQPIILSVLIVNPSYAARFTPNNLCAVTSNSGYESITLPITLGGEYTAGNNPTVTTIVGDTQEPGGAQAGNGDIEFVILLLDTDNDGTPESQVANSCNFDTSTVPVGCSVTQNFPIPNVTEDTTFRGRVMLSYNDQNPTNSCGNNGFGDSEDFLLTANVQEYITLEDVSQNENGGPITVTAMLTHSVSNASGPAAFSVDYVLTDGSAMLSDNDYVSSTGTLNFSGTANEQVTFTIDPVADNTPEADETLIISLQNLTNVTHGIDISDTATITLINDDEDIDLVMNKSVSDPTPNIGDTIIFTLSVQNVATGSANNATVQDTVPAGFTSLTALSVPPGTNFSIAGNTIEWTGINLASGTQLSATFSAVVMPP